VEGLRPPLEGGLVELLAELEALVELLEEPHPATSRRATHTLSAAGTLFMARSTLA